MRYKNFNISINSVTDLYAFFEESALKLDYSWDFVEPISNLKQGTADPEVLQHLQWELACFAFEFRGAELFSLAYSYDSADEAFQKFPSAKDFEDAGFRYINDRAKAVRNPLLTARYNHLLWKGPKGVKKREHAVSAIESYAAAIKLLLDLKESRKEEKYLQVSNHYESLAGLCSEINYESRNLIIEITKEILYQRTVPFFLRHAVLDTMLKNPKYFKAGDFNGTLELFEKELKSEQLDHFLMVNYYMPTALKIAQKTAGYVRIWHEHTGDLYRHLAEREIEEERNWIKLDYYTRAIHSYRSAANESKKKEVEQLYFELKPKVKLPSVEVKFDVTELYQELQNLAERILKEPAERVYAIVMLGKGIFTSLEKLKSSQDNEYDFLNSVYRIDFDRNKNISSDKSTQGEPFIDPYHWEVQGKTLPLLEFIFTKGIQSGKLTFENFIIFLKQRTWLGKPHTRIDLGGESTNIDWIKLVAPSIVEYFVQTKSNLENKFYTPDYTLCIDSLALKLEGLLRNFCERLNIATNVAGRVGIQEANINQVLEIEGLKNYFDEDDFALFKYILLNEGGTNLRNNVAHCFYNQDDYVRSKMHLLLAALLRIGKYNIKSNE